ncbi:MAG: hypothetical protein SGI87_11510 [Flavobacteriales bacterium]|nr:hypothetical protein [Flavobacteriales bacterium]
MNQKIAKKISLLFGCIVSLSCNHKLHNQIDYEVFLTGYNVRLNDAIISDSVWTIVGGIRGEEGKIIRSKDQGNTWNEIYSIQGKSLYSIIWDTHNLVWVGGEYITLLKSENTVDWEAIDFGSQLPFHEEDRPSIRSISVPFENTISFVGGENLGEGIIYRSTDSGEHWQFEFFQHELRDCLWINENLVIAAGHGALFRADTSFTQIQNPNTNYAFHTSLNRMNEELIICADQSGKIIVTEDAGLSWQEVLNNRISPLLDLGYNDVDSIEEMAVACGNGGLISFSRDGKQWRNYFIRNEPNLYSVQLHENKCYFTSDEGKIFVTEIQF